MNGQATGLKSEATSTAIIVFRVTLTKGSSGVFVPGVLTGIFCYIGWLISFGLLSEVRTDTTLGMSRFMKGFVECFSKQGIC